MMWYVTCPYFWSCHFSIKLASVWETFHVTSSQFFNSELHPERCIWFVCILQKLLATMGANKVSAYVTHGVFPNRSWERFVHDNGGTLQRHWLHLFRWLERLTRYYLEIEHLIPYYKMWLGRFSSTGGWVVVGMWCRGRGSWVCSLLVDWLMCEHRQRREGQRTFWGAKSCWFDSCCPSHLEETW